MLAELSMISMAIRTAMALRLTSTPIRPIANAAAAKYKNHVRGMSEVIAGDSTRFSLVQLDGVERDSGRVAAGPPGPLPEPEAGAGALGRSAARATRCGDSSSFSW